MFRPTEPTDRPGFAPGAPTPGGPATTAQGPRYDLLDVWRGVACLMVVVHHAGYALRPAEARGVGPEAVLRRAVLVALERMSLGVPLFFVISGYCILASLDATRRRGGSPWAFLSRRLWRIYPPYWVALLWFVGVVVALDGCGLGRLHDGEWAVKLGSPGALDLPRWVGNITLTEMWRPRVWGPGRDVYTGVAWSLCYEEQFYFLCFLALLIAPRRVEAALVALTLASGAARVGAWWAGHLEGISGVFPMFWHQFAVGLAVYYRLNRARTWRARRATEAGVGALLLIAAAWGVVESATAAAFGLVLIALRGWDGRARRAPWLDPLRACGRRCYSIYLAHLPVCVVGNLALYELGVTGFWARALVMIPVVSAASVAVSWVFFRWVESYFLNAPAAARGTSRVAVAPVRVALGGEAAGLPT